MSDGQYRWYYELRGHDGTKLDVGDIVAIRIQKNRAWSLDGLAVVVSSVERDESGRLVVMYCINSANTGFLMHKGSTFRISASTQSSPHHITVIHKESP